MTHDHEYLGDGVYASHDGYHIWLDLRGQDPTGTIKIALDPRVWDALVEYHERISQDAGQDDQAGETDEP